jgi:hypothetical protein
MVAKGRAERVKCIFYFGGDGQDIICSGSVPKLLINNFHSGDKR